MSNARDGFDAIAVVVDWIDAFRQSRLGALLDLYADDATVECCDGVRFRGRSELERYWRPTLARTATGTFEVDALFPEQDGVSLDYRGHDGRAVRTLFRFDDAGKIRLTASAPVRQAA